LDGYKLAGGNDEDAKAESVKEKAEGKEPGYTDSA
jgi:hypothetical protein